MADAPVAFAGAIMAGLARLNEMFSLHAAEFGVGITVIAGSISVLARLSTGDGIAPGGGLGGTSLMVSGEAAELVSALPGAAVQVLPGLAVPSGGAGAIVPVVLPLTPPRIITGIAGGKVGGGLVLEVVGMRFEVIDVTLDPGTARAPIGLMVVDAEGVVVAVTLITEGERATAVGEQLKLVPGMVGSVANGGEASVVAGAPGTVDGEKRLTNGPGPLSGDETMAPGVVGIAICVVPNVDIWARHGPPPSKSIARLARKIRIFEVAPAKRCSGLATSSRARRLGLRRDLAALGEIHHRIENHDIASPEALLDQNFPAEIARD